MPRQTEPNANNALGGLLQPMLPGSRVMFENTRVIAGRPALQPDLLITDPGRAPVVIEAEYLPAANVEAEARARLDLPVTVHARPIEAAIALRYPAAVGDAPDLRAALAAARLEYCVFTLVPGPDPVAEAAVTQRFPAAGWLAGSVADLADLVRLVSVPQCAVDQAATTLQDGIDAAAKLLDAVDASRPGITRKMAQLLGMANVPQTRRMACAIIANALVFHERIAGMHAEVEPLDLVCGDTTPNPKGALLAAWAAILKINYWPIFAIAKDLLSHLPAGDAAAIGTLRVADFACGTGALLSAVYERLARPARTRRRRPGGAASGDDGRSAVRLRRDALGGAYHRRDPLRRTAGGGVRQNTPLHLSLRPDEGRQCADRLAGATG